MNYTTGEIAEICSAELTGVSDSRISHVSLDSRNIYRTEGVLFIALKGERHDGHTYIPELAERGIRSFMVQELPGGMEPGDITFLLVRDTLEALQVLASSYRKDMPAEIIGITGSNGKTIIKEWVGQVLSPDYRTVRSPKSYNSQIGVPLSVLMLEEDTEKGIFEAGISRPGEMEKLEKIIRPHTGIFTNIGDAHQEGFRDREEKIREKLILFSECERLVYCSDDNELERVIRQSIPEEKLFCWSHNKSSNIRILSKDEQEGETKMKLAFKEHETDVLLPFGDRASVDNAMHVIALMLLLEYDPLLIQARIQDLIPVAMRMELVRGINDCTLINDTYNSDLDSLSIALDYLNRQDRYASRTLILSDIMQSGRDEAALYSEVAGMVKQMNVSRFIGIGPSLCANRRFFNPGSLFYLSSGEFLRDMHTMKFRNEAILLKGSRSFAFEKITQSLQEKVHRTVLEIDLNAMIHNLNIYRSMSDARIMVMVKAFSYGSGALEIASALQYQKVDYLCVAYVDEGILLREAGIHLPVLVMNPEPSGFDPMIAHHLEPEIYNFRSLFSFISAMEKNNLDTYPVHLKLETGMNRLGFREEELKELFEVLEKHPELCIQSIFSHLGASDDEGLDSNTLEQIDIFKRMSDLLIEKVGNHPLRHILNSAGIERFPQAAYDMVRLGIGLYGISSTIENRLETVSTLKSVISQVKPVKKGESVGYGRGYTAGKDILIGIVPVGYADGLRRDMGQRGVTFLLKGQEVPVLGNLCMDMCMIDISGTGASEGDEVIIFGKDKPVSDLAEKLDTISYEVLAGLSQRVKRVYFQE